MMRSFLILVSGACARPETPLDEGWKFLKVGTPVATCTDKDFPTDRTDQHCNGLALQAQVFDEDGCQATCCGDDECEVYQWCPAGSNGCSPPQSCYTGKVDQCEDHKGWVSRSRKVTPAPAPAPGQTCNEPECKPAFDDSHWETVNIPHDFALEQNFSKSADKRHGYLPYLKGWYRLHFQVDEALKGDSLWLEFDGVYKDSDVFLNGEFLGHHSSGYTSFRYDVTAAANYGAENVLVVKVDTTQPDSWWYDGAGIYRHVRLQSHNPVHVAPWGVYLPAEVTGDISAEQVADATVTIETLVVNTATDDAQVSASHTIEDPSGVKVGTVSTAQTLVKAGGNATLTTKISIKQAQLWSDTTPRVYKCVTTLSNDDVAENTFGIRKMEWNKDKGFILNNRQVKIRGFANHQDFAGVGVGVPDSLQTYRVWQMKEMGANAWRTAHNPPTPALLDECDRQGMLVWDENHRNLDSAEMVEDLKSLVLRDRNHPSVIMWSICNEALCESFDAASAKVLKPIIKQLDPQGQRPVTAAMNGGYDSEFQDVLDVFGVNYHHAMYDDMHAKHPEQPMIGSETSSDYSDRYIYQNDDKERMYVSSYDVNYPGWGATAEDAWCSIAERDFMAGGFYWTAYDYKGEPTPYGWPNVNSHFGVMDIAGFPKDNYYYHQSVFFKPEEKPMVHIVPMHWNFKTGKTVSVWAYTNGDAVELFLNNKSLGLQKISKCRHVEWNVTHAAGVLKAQAYRDGVPVAVDTVATHGDPVAVKLETAWPLSKELVADNSDTALVTVSLVDSEGRVTRSVSADSSMHVSFTLEGEGRIIGKGNGDPSNQEADKPASPTEATHSVFGGLARLLVQSTHKDGTITLRAEAKGLKAAELSIESKALSLGNVAAYMVV